ncbi:MAG: YggT family protein [Magnetococcales bacterium]|nr:YggT family protein [Magnetococcales bacterium]
MGLFASIATILNFVLELLSWMVVIRVLLSWVNPDPYNPLVQFLVRTTDPLLRPLQRLLPTLGGLDFSPIVALLLLALAKRILVALSTGLSTGGAMLMLVNELFIVVHLLITFYLILFLVRSGLNLWSWISFRRGQPAAINLYNPWVRFIFQATEPVLRRLRPSIPTLGGMDLTPFLAVILTIFLLGLLQNGMELLMTPASSAIDPPSFMP